MKCILTTLLVKRFMIHYLQDLTIVMLSKAIEILGSNNAMNYYKPPKKTVVIKKQTFFGIIIQMNAWKF